jgi:hypothetical protein
VALYVNFSTPLGGKKIITPCSKCPLSMRFFGHVQNSPMYKGKKSHQQYGLYKLHFRLSKAWLSPSGSAQKTISSPLNVMISQTISTNYLICGGHVHIQVIYKILQLQVLK